MSFYEYGYTSSCINRKLIAIHLGRHPYTCIDITELLFKPVVQFVLPRAKDECSFYFISAQFSSVLSLNHVGLYTTPWAAAHQASLSITNSQSAPKPCLLSQWCHPTASFSVVPFSSCPQSFPTSGSFQMTQLFASGGQSIGVSASTSVLPMNTQDWTSLGWTVGSPCSPRDSQESSPTPRFKSINSSALSFLYSPTLTSIHNHWKNHSLD